MAIDIDFEDRLAVLGLLAGVFIILVGLGVLLGMPWTTTANTAAALVQVVGIFATIAVGIFLIIITVADEPGAYLPG